MLSDTYQNTPVGTYQYMWQQSTITALQWLLLYSSLVHAPHVKSVSCSSNPTWLYLVQATKQNTTKY
jgi:hypothetical protein